MKIDKSNVSQIEKTVKKIVENPTRKPVYIRGHRLLKMRSGDYRILYIVCELCQNEGMQDFYGCQECDSIPDNAVIFVFVGHRKNVYQKYDSYVKSRGSPLR